ncbi:hypothetical protein [Rhodopseudomonas palustris]|uniref:Uncharacterized protein n=1 Tax=Rhodopseudomonas palustris (strain BisB18) TaxID=316056 RepID=Q218R5_RHOPB
MTMERFPGILGEIAEVAGEEAALKIGAAYGGTRCSIPAQIPDGPHWLLDCVGRDAAEAISAHFRMMSAGGRYMGAYLEIPLGSSAKMEFHQMVIALSSGGCLVREIALELKTTERNVYRHLARHRGRRPRPKPHRLWLSQRGERKE